MLGSLVRSPDQVPSQPASEYGDAQNQPSRFERSHQPFGPVIGSDVFTGSSASSHDVEYRIDARVKDNRGWPRRTAIPNVRGPESIVKLFPDRARARREERKANVRNWRPTMECGRAV